MDRQENLILSWIFLLLGLLNVVLFFLGKADVASLTIGVLALTATGITWRRLRKQKEAEARRPANEVRASDS
ncbi:hypothetical protein GC425_04720 [Corynebacterium sp. zg254]|uniref:LPXTG cell wall anchor domain-containing protein n=1 Tax=Corynebacterium zhongnanshanii TaxID=2768834 RepID=A0ABQ6VEL6_9CORY|nr:MULTISPECIES: hypothetical protein [Corynebacterium]KAB3522763.1 hypothetical protein F8377_00895 [Corynebacterium zhongnanshanii]MCR5914175.1 hypothetical protein [Corynebacterium sp. zg254]